MVCAQGSQGLRSSFMMMVAHKAASHLAEGGGVQCQKPKTIPFQSWVLGWIGELTMDHYWLCCPAQNEMVKWFRVVISSFNADDKGSCG